MKPKLSRRHAEGVGIMFVNGCLCLIVGGTAYDACHAPHVGAVMFIIGTMLVAFAVYFVITHDVEGP